MEIKSHRMDRDLDVRCPLCSAILSGATSFGKKAPKPGDLSICIRCRGVLQFQKGPVAFRHFTDEEISELPKETQKHLALMRKAAEGCELSQSN